MNKKFIAAAMAGTMALSLAACGGSSASTGESTAASTSTDTAASSAAETSAASGSMSVAWWGNQTRNERTQQVLDAYGEANGISFDGQFAEWSDYWNKLATASAGHTLPDVVQMDYSYLQQYVSNGLLVDLTPYVEDGTLDVSNVSETVLNSGKVDGKLYAIPLGVNVPAVMYNKDLLDENGIEIHDNMTLDEFYDVCREVYEKTGYKTDVFYGNGADYCAYVLRGEGGHLYNGSEIGATEEQIEAFFDIYETGIAEGWACDPAIYAERTIGTPEQMPLVYGSSPSTMSWCSFTWSNALSALQNADSANFTIEMTTWPSKDPKTSDYLKPSMFFCITADSTQPGEAAKLLNYWINDVDANKTLLGERGIPVSSETANGIKDLLDTSSQKAVDFVNNVVTPNSTPIDAPSPEGSAEVNQQVNQLVEKVCYGELTAKEAAAQLLSAGNAALNK